MMSRKIAITTLCLLGIVFAIVLISLNAFLSQPLQEKIEGQQATSPDNIFKSYQPSPNPNPTVETSSISIQSIPNNAIDQTSQTSEIERIKAIKLPKLNPINHNSQHQKTLMTIEELSKALSELIPSSSTSSSTSLSNQASTPTQQMKKLNQQQADLEKQLDALEQLRQSENPSN